VPCEVSEEATGHPHDYSHGEKRQECDHADARAQRGEEEDQGDAHPDEEVEAERIGGLRRAQALRRVDVRHPVIRAGEAEERDEERGDSPPETPVGYEQSGTELVKASAFLTHI